jgi:pimeloyl-ACP methyl ester carboxylesterase
MKGDFMPTESSLFKTPELERQFMQTYEAVLGLWQVPNAALDIPTSFGLTHVNTAGSGDEPAMVLLPGFGANSTMWFPNIAALSAEFRCYAVDTNGQPGKSLPGQKLTVSNSADWLDELMDGLRLRKACFVGVSLGGWLALNLAIRRPERVEKAVLLDPAASFEKMSGAFLRHSFLPFMVHPTRPGLVKYFRWITRGYRVNEHWAELMLRGILNTRPQPPIRATPFSDAQLLSVQVPVMALIGERSLIYNPRRACERARRLIPGVQAEIVPGASHALNAEKAGWVNERIVDFCKEIHLTVTMEGTVT